MRTIKLTHTQADEIIVSELTSSMNGVIEDITRIRNMIDNSDLTFSQNAIQHDLSYDFAYLDAVYVVLKHFTTHNSPEREVIDGLRFAISTAEELPLEPTNTHKMTDH